MTSERGKDARSPGPPLTEREAEEQAHGIAFKTGPPGRVGVELEWLVCDGRDPALPVDQRRVAAALARLDEPGALPGRGRLTTEPGGQVELSSAPASGLGGCVAAARSDLTAVRQAIAPAGLSLAGHGLDPLRPPRRVLNLPRYVAMEEFFDRSGPWGRVMMCSTASVQVCVDAGQERGGPSGFRWRWHLLHGLGPVLVALFANSPFQAGRPSGWKSTRQAVWSRLDPSRTRAPADGEPGAPDRGTAWPEDTDPRSAWVSYVLDAQVMVLRDPVSRRWTAPSGLTFRDWVRGAIGPPPTADDLTYHMSTLFPPVRPRGHLELRVIDAQPGDGWIVPTAVVSALLDDPVAAQAAMAAVEPLQKEGRPGGLLLRAARHGQDDPPLATASRECFAAADAALGRLGAPGPIRDMVTRFADRYVLRGRCPADDRLDEARAAVSLPHDPRNPDACLEESP
ncbi:MAG TPA: ergothioneine biosynthesis glutamate--cysteine ligase EgtA [Streptosporangiaceae bacterium]